MRYLRQNAADSWHGILLYIVGEFRAILLFSLRFLSLSYVLNSTNYDQSYRFSHFVHVCMYVNGLKAFLLKKTLVTLFLHTYSESITIRMYLQSFNLMMN